MSSPRVDHDITLEGEKMSPIKLPIIIDSTSNQSFHQSPSGTSTIVNKNHEFGPSKLLGKHPHGLTSKYENRRNTIHNLMQTPPANTDHTYPNTINHFPITSVPKLSPKLQNLRNSIQLTADKLNSSDKENYNFLSPDKFSNQSSPLRSKRLHNDLTNYNRKIAKIIVSEDHEQEEELQVTGVRVKIHDLVGQMKDLKKSEDNTIVSKITSVDYVTPQRYTEPVAQSPASNPRINEVIEDNTKSNTLTSPLKTHKIHHHDSDDDDEDLPNNFELENEPTVNFMSSPNSKPYFSINYIKQIQESHDNEIIDLEKIINSKNEQILSLSQELQSTNGQFLKFEKEIKDLKQIHSKVKADKELITIQFNQNNHEIGSLNKKIKIKENLVLNLEDRIVKLNQKINELNQSNEALSENYNKLTDKFEEQAEKLTSLEESINEKVEEITTLTDSNLQFNLKIENLLKEKEDHLNEIEALKSKEQELNDSVATFKKTIAENDSMINELKAKINTYDQTCKNYEVELKNFNQEFKNLNEILDKNEDEKIQLNNKVNELLQLNSNLANDEKSLSKEIDYLKTENQKLIDANNEKDGLIKIDGQKIDTLVQKVNHLESNNSNKQLLSQIADLKEQVAMGQEKTDLRIREVAEQLYFQYSKKHEDKVNLLKNSYKKQIESINNELKHKSRDNESLEKKLNVANKEIESLLNLLEDEKKRSSSKILASNNTNIEKPSSTKRKLSPKRTGGRRLNIKAHHQI